jgi:hypothetical protein
MAFLSFVDNPCQPRPHLVFYQAGEMLFIVLPSAILGNLEQVPHHVLAPDGIAYLLA